MITAHALTKAYGSRPVLDRMDLAAHPGQITLLVGANGSGKSTTLRLLAGLSAPDSGQVSIHGHDLRSDRAAALSGLSYLPQAPRFHPLLSTSAILRFYARLRDLPEERCGRVARLWHLDDVQEIPTGRLSGGMRQRLALAVLMLPPAPILLLDEPGLSLDPDWRRILQRHLQTAAQDGCTVVVATHLLGEWDGQADRCLVLEQGRIGRELEPDQLRDAFPFAHMPGDRAGGAAVVRRAR